MTDRRHADYYAQREQQERDAAERTTDPIARRVHLDLAARYAAKATELVAA
ncbi:hypothetical protein M9980_09155 [Sphingomonas donggukensis]|uniref:Uncharacterized protein n=1 Tax=Sphingomonas donggukensis TaxID=2949093 RepID=A0ABY4TTK6_9SPHN|nr:hypothetical protein [Sphingomonas donggukensis]URW74742.1 hypothetical protein M9980_09155 [Sphingomonas donggukensis]